MSTYSQREQRNQRRYRQKRGELVLFAGVLYRVFVEAVAGANAGEQAVARATYGVFIASSDPEVFDFDPLDFAPFASAAPPIEGSEFTRNGLVYVCTAVRYENEDTDTTGLYCECLRKIWAVPPAP